ncbi:MAG: transcription-repair coupling factor [Chloroflexota bacterium]|nr:MAG: transcription-repair coupling factor [Chloroflexota bacterium]
MKLTSLLSVFEDVPAYERLLNELDSGRSRAPLGLLSTARPALLSRLFLDRPRTIVLVTGRIEAVPMWQQVLDAWLPDGMPALRFPEPTPLPFERGPWSSSSRNQRLGVLGKLMADQHPMLGGLSSRLLILTSARALLQKTLPRQRFAGATRIIRTGQVLDLTSVVTGWQRAGYERVSTVEAEGGFSIRGGILDIYPVGASFPARVELFGDQVETLRAFDPATQRSEDMARSKLDHIVIPPGRELLPGDVVEVGQHLERSIVEESTDLPSWRDDVPALADGKATPNLEYYLPMVYSQPASLLSYLPQDALIVIDDLREYLAAAEEVHTHADQIANEQLDIPPNYPSPLFDWQALTDEVLNRTVMVLGEGREDDAFSDSDLSEVIQPGPRYGGQVRPFLMRLRAARTLGETTVVVSQQAVRLAELWHEDNSSASIEPGLQPDVMDSVPVRPTPGSLSFVQGSLGGGFVLYDQEQAGTRTSARGDRILLNVLSDAEVFGWSRPVPRRRLKSRVVAPETYYADMGPGDYVVHLEFGVGQFAGLVVRSVGGANREYLQVNFGNGDVLYVPAHHADRLSKWIGPDDRSPKLHRLGEKGWKRAKAKAQEAADDLAEDLLDLYAARETIAGHAFAQDAPWQAELEAGFPYRETDDQLEAIAQVKSDMERPYPMDRLICGDVGYGKTEVALRAAFKAVMDDKQVAILVPTTVLAQQHYNTFLERLRPFPVNVEMLSRFRTTSRQDRIVKGLREGQIDIVVGTHRLFSDDVSFKDLGLLIIDEEQRFGVNHKEKLKQLRTEVDVLTMTATPIPRTLYMSLAGVRDISQIDTAPADRLPVQTYVGELEDSIVRRAILRELDRGGQVFYVHNRVQTINNAFTRLVHLVPEATVAIGHGQMSERELEDVMLRFVNGEVDILLSTTIIESGLDIPNTNTLIVERADQFGLAQLYQLRGRVGRGARRAYAYFLHPKWHGLTADAKVRLDVIAAQSDLGAGYNIAMRDLEIRGAGDLLGARQSGHIAAVGFDLYTRLLTRAVKRRRAARDGEQLPTELPESVLIDLPLPAYVPQDYVPEASLRLRLYRRMAVLDSLQSIEDMAVELADRFGPIPDPVDNLLYQLRIKVLAITAGVLSVASESGQLQIRLPASEHVGRLILQRQLGPDVKVSRKGVWLGRGLTTREWQVILVQTLEKIGTMQDRPSVRPDPTTR